MYTFPLRIVYCGMEGTGALWNLWDWSILRPRPVTAGYIDQHQGLNDIVLIFIQQKQRKIRGDDFILMRATTSFQFPFIYCKNISMA